MNRRLSVFVVVISLLFSFCVPPVSAATSGRIMDMAWSFSSSKKTLYLDDVSPGPMPDNINSGTGTFPEWISFHDNIEHIVIKEGLTSISNGAFYFLTNLKSVSIPKTVTSIGKNAFSRCYSLSNVTLPGKLTSIGAGAFSQSGLTSITIPNGVTALGDHTFYKCPNLTRVTMPGVSIGSSTFSVCKELESVTFTTSGAPDLKIGEHAFESCESLKEIHIPEGVWWIDPYAFYKCSSLTTVTLPSTLTTIGADAFSDCQVLTDLVLPEKLTRIGAFAFKYCYGLNRLTFPASVEQIGQTAFYDCENMTEIYFQGNAPQFNDYAFSHVKTTAYYPAADSTWESAITRSYGGTIKWQPYCFQGHDWEEATCFAPRTCKNCGTTEGDPVHSFEYSLATAPTYLSEGQLIGTCVHCAATDPIAIPPLSNADYSYSVVVAPTLEEDGIGRYTWNNTAYGTISFEFPISYQKGDLNTDGQVNDEDVIYLLWHTLIPDSYTILGDADFTLDGCVNDDDVIYLLWHTLIPDLYPL